MLQAAVAYHTPNPKLPAEAWCDPAEGGLDRPRDEGPAEAARERDHRDGREEREQDEQDDGERRRLHGRTSPMANAPSRVLACRCWWNAPRRQRTRRRSAR